MATTKNQTVKENLNGTKARMEPFGFNEKTGWYSLYRHFGENVTAYIQPSQNRPGWTDLKIVVSVGMNAVGIVGEGERCMGLCCHWDRWITESLDVNAAREYLNKISIDDLKIGWK